MCDKQVRGPWWYNITYENWFVLVGIYGLGKLKTSAAGAGTRIDQGQHARPLLTQLVTRVGKLRRTVEEQQKTIQKLVEEQQQGLTSHNQGASQIADDDDAMENWARYYGYGDEDED
ncbi:uncharacterized protein FFB14_05786 [Fusarium fujikuroi]|nr:uncharacterized protein FFB14_05786 [Fusarium fujikuroi]